MIKLTVNNEIKLAELIKTVEGKSKERLLTVDLIKKELAYIHERHLGITKKALEGTIVYVDVNAQNFPNAYKYTPHSTTFTAKFFKGSWQINNIYRDKCGNKKALITLSDTAKAALLEVKSKY